MVNGGSIAGAAASDVRDESARLDDLEQQMRSLMSRQQQLATSAAATTSDRPVVERDACTIAALRAAGVSGYQGDAEKEAALSVALADAEFFTKQTAVNDCCSTAATLSKKTSKVDAFDSLASTLEPEVIDMDDLQDFSGYGKK